MSSKISKLFSELSIEEKNNKKYEFFEEVFEMKPFSPSPPTSINPCVVSCFSSDFKSFVQAPYLGEYPNFFNSAPYCLSSITLLEESQKRKRKESVFGIKDVSPLSTFKKIFNPLYDVMLQEMNNMREKRCIARNTAKGTRGRPIVEGNTSNNRENYISQFRSRFTLEELHSFLACFFRMSTINAHSIEDYWKMPSTQECGHGSWFSPRLSRHKFEEMFRCLDPNIEKLVSYC
jgi:hypothetical protein